MVIYRFLDRADLFFIFEKTEAKIFSFLFLGWIGFFESSISGFFFCSLLFTSFIYAHRQAQLKYGRNYVNFLLSYFRPLHKKIHKNLYKGRYLG